MQTKDKSGLKVVFSASTYNSPVVKVQKLPTTVYEAILDSAYKSYLNDHDDNAILTDTINKVKKKLDE